ncbi:cytochrome P450 [Endozoicomonas numazuensis]|nr:cytochrome P450 [Endozoicomonas numazuensis]
MERTFYHLRRQLLSHTLEGLISLKARRTRTDSSSATKDAYEIPKNPVCPEDFRPLENSCFQNPYAFYKMIRDEHPVYQLPNGIYCISRYEDIVKVSRDTDCFSSTHQGSIASLKKGQSIIQEGNKMHSLARLGLVPTDVMAVSDPPEHKTHRKVGHKGLNAHYVKSLEPELKERCQKLMDEILAKGEFDFMHDFAWRFPLSVIIQLLGLPADDYEKIKTWCERILETQSGISNPQSLAKSHIASLRFIRYCWKQFLKLKKQPEQNMTKLFAQFADDPESEFTDRLAISLIFQLLMAGSDSSATSMGNAVKLLIENPDVQQQLRDDPEKITAFVEEVFRLETAFQGHFRWTKKDTEIQGVRLPKESRIFLMWASGNRDERFWDDPDLINLERKNGKKHLTFGHGIHACIGRELARMEIIMAIRMLLERTENLSQAGETPFVASMFAHTLLRLPISVTLKSEKHNNSNHRLKESAVA